MVFRSRDIRKMQEIHLLQIGSIRLEAIAIIGLEAMAMHFLHVIKRKLTLPRSLSLSLLRPKSHFMQFPKHSLSFLNVSGWFSERGAKTKRAHLLGVFLFVV